MRFLTPKPFRTEKLRLTGAPAVNIPCYLFQQHQANIHNYTLSMSTGQNPALKKGGYVFKSISLHTSEGPSVCTGDGTIICYDLPVLPRLSQESALSVSTSK